MIYNICTISEIYLEGIAGGEGRQLLSKLQSLLLPQYYIIKFSMSRSADLST